MPRLTIEFNLPEEQEDLDHAMRGEKYFFALTDFAEQLRKVRKYGEIPEAEQKVRESIESDFYEILRERGIEL